MGLSYQWNLDFAGPLSLTPQHNQYILIMIKHFSKWLELVPLPNHSNDKTTYAFLDKVFNKFNILVEVLVNQRTKFQGIF